jgi:hypothetical protein
LHQVVEACSVADVNVELATLRSAVADVGALDTGVIPSRRMPDLAAEVTRLANALHAIAALWLAVADRDGVCGLLPGSAASSHARKTGTSRRAAHAAVKLGRNLADTPGLADATVSGEVSPETAAVIATVADHPAFAQHGDTLIDTVKGTGPTAARVAVDLWRHQHANVQDPAVADDEAANKRDVSFTERADGLVELRAILTRRAATTIDKRLRSIVARTADDNSRRTFGQRMADALCELAADTTVNRPSGPRRGATLLGVIDYTTLFERAGTPGWASDGSVLAVHEIEQLMCDADIHPVVRSTHGQILYLGSAVRFAPHEHWLALAARDGGCRWPDCHAPPEQCTVHHEPPMPDGATDITKEILLCTGVHHHQRHRPGTTAHLDPTTAAYTVTTPEGYTFTTWPRTTTRQQPAA